MRNSDGVRVHRKKQRWGENLPGEKENGVKVDHKKKSKDLKVYHEKERWDES